MGPQATARGQLFGGENQTIKLCRRINMGQPADLCIAEVVLRRRFVPVVFLMGVAGKYTDGTVPGMALGDCGRLAGPVDSSDGADALFLPAGCELRKTAKIVFVIAHC